MTFSLAGSVITQANEAGIAITAAVSITGGVRFTCTQSYAVGNLVRITGTTSYNGEWMVAAVTGTTFDVKLSEKGDTLAFVSSQTGTGRIVPDQFGNKMMIIEDIEEGSLNPTPSAGIRGL